MYEKLCTVTTRFPSPFTGTSTYKGSIRIITRSSIHTNWWCSYTFVHICNTRLKDYVQKLKVTPMSYGHQQRTNTTLVNNRTLLKGLFITCTNTCV